MALKRRTALRAVKEDCLSFVRGPHLHGVEGEALVAAADALLVHLKQRQLAITCAVRAGLLETQAATHRGSLTPCVGLQCANPCAVRQHGLHSVALQEGLRITHQPQCSPFAHRSETAPHLGRARVRVLCHRQLCGGTQAHGVV